MHDRCKQTVARKFSFRTFSPTLKAACSFKVARNPHEVTHSMSTQQVNSRIQKRTHGHTPPEAPHSQSLKTTIKSHYGGVAALQEPMLTSQRMRGGLCTQGKDNRGRYDHYLHKAMVASLQQGQHVGNLHLNRMDNLWGEIHSPNSYSFTNLTECLPGGAQVHVQLYRAVPKMQHCPPMVVGGMAGRGNSHERKTWNQTLS